MSRIGRDLGALSQSNSSAELAPAWKQEVNRRLAAHRTRTDSTKPSIVPVDAQRGASSASAAAAARVAARYAKAPSYSQMLAEDARASVRAAAAAARAAREAQAAAEQVLQGIEAGMKSAQALTPKREPIPAGRTFRELAEPLQEWPAWETPVEPVTAAMSAQIQNVELVPVEGLLDATWPPQSTAAAAAAASRSSGLTEIAVEEWWQPAEEAQEPRNPFQSARPEPPESSQPFHANLIEFPRELVATRKARPRQAEAPAPVVAGQLSIFEVDPGAIAIEPAAAAPSSEPAPAWPEPVWRGIELDEEAVEASVAESIEVKTEARQMATIGWRSLAFVVDGSLVVSVFLAAAAVAAANVEQFPTLKQMEMGSGVALLVIGALYLAIFYALAKATPGMMYAGISVATLNDRRPTRGQMQLRLGALLLSLLPVGLGVAWALFDEEHLSWHDRLSGTYLRRG
jgi:uncharacterized RDD family membrane protein YckC